MRWMDGRLSPSPSLLFTWLQIEKERGEKEKGSIIPPPLAPDQTPLPPNVELPLSFVCLATIDPLTDWTGRGVGQGRQGEEDLSAVAQGKSPSPDVLSRAGAQRKR